MGEPAKPIPDDIDDEGVPADWELSPEWLDEIKRRARDVEEGRSELIPWETVREGLYAELRKQ